MSPSRKNENTHIHMDSVGGEREQAVWEGRKEGWGTLDQGLDPLFLEPALLQTSMSQPQISEN